MGKKHSSLSRRKRAACLRNLRKAWKAPRRKAYELTPARLEACRANSRKAAEANHLRYQATRRRRAASLANAVKAREANRQNFRFTEARRAASALTIRQAQAAERTPESYARSRFNHLKHGLDVRTLEETLKQLGDDPKEYAAHCRRFERVFAPENPAEQKVVRLLAAVVWRRLRLFQAQVRWETDRLKYFFTHAPAIQPLDPELTRLRAHGLMGLLLDRERLNRHDRLLTVAMERELRVLLRLRTGSDAQFKFFSHETSAEEKRIKELEREVRTYDRLASGDPEAWKVVEKIMPRWVRS
ncbi:MAG: hypothetical protein ABSA70_17025 [Terriglobia bacterium]